MNWKFWERKKNISEPVLTLAKELQNYDNWSFTNLHDSHYALHKEKNIKLNFQIDIDYYWQCTNSWLTQDECFFLGKYFKEWHNEKKKKEKQKQDIEERNRVRSELGGKFK